MLWLWFLEFLFLSCLKDNENLLKHKVGMYSICYVERSSFRKRAHILNKGKLFKFYRENKN